MYRVYCYHFTYTKAHNFLWMKKTDLYNISRKAENSDFAALQFPPPTCKYKAQTRTLTSTYIYASKYVVFWVSFNNSIKALLQTRGSISCFVGYIVITQRLFFQTGHVCSTPHSRQGLCATWHTNTHTQSPTLPRHKEIDPDTLVCDLLWQLKAGVG